MLKLDTDDGILPVSINGQEFRLDLFTVNDVFDREMSGLDASKDAEAYYAKAGEVAERLTGVKVPGSIAVMLWHDSIERTGELIKKARRPERNAN